MSYVESVNYSTQNDKMHASKIVAAREAIHSTGNGISLSLAVGKTGAARELVIS